MLDATYVELDSVEVVVHGCSETLDRVLGPTDVATSVAYDHGLGS